jgi:argininosuccinate lyase
VEAFTASIDVDSRLYRYDIAGSIAHAKMLARQRIIPARDARKIVRGLKTIEQELDRGKFVFSSADEDIHMNIERRLSEKIGAAGRKLHTARSRNDQVALDMRLFLREEVALIIESLQMLQRELTGVAKKNLDDHYARLYAPPARSTGAICPSLACYEMFERDRERFRLFRARQRAPARAGALAGTSFPIDRNYV